jgi:hypothetical protein
MRNSLNRAVAGLGSRASGRETSRALPTLGPSHGLSVEGSNPFARSNFFTHAKLSRPLYHIALRFLCDGILPSLVLYFQP